MYFGNSGVTHLLTQTLRGRGSAAVERLEAALGARLLERTTRQVRPTEAGETLHHGIGPLFTAPREAHTDALAQGDTVAGTLRIASSHAFGAQHLGPVAFVRIFLDALGVRSSVSARDV